ncbi:MAG: polyprenyl synthetase family protein [Actinomycetes bacterium]
MSPLDALGLPGLPDDLERIEGGLRSAVAHADPFLGEVAGHLVAAGGKRLRPALAIVAARAARGADAPVDAVVITGGCSVELVHLGSLYHDDVIDEAETRRGVESVNARWSNIVAILAGDFLLARASELAASLGADVAALLASTIGELCRGQVLELQNLFNPEHEREAYLSAIAGKTASLFATSSRIGGMVSGVDESTLSALTAFGDHLGMCFQIVDDILDLTADTDTLGKPAGNDLMEGVYTLPVIAALERSAELRARLGGEIAPEEVDGIRAMVRAAGGVEVAREVAIVEATKANDVLRSAPALDPAVTDGMIRLVDGLIDRTS